THRLSWTAKNSCECTPRTAASTSASQEGFHIPTSSSRSQSASSLGARRMVMPRLESRFSALPVSNGALASRTVMLWLCRSVLTLLVPKTSSRSCDQAIFVDQATGAGVSSDAVLVEIDRFGQRLQRRGAVQGAVRPMLVVVDLVVAQDPPQMVLVPHQGAVQELAAASPDPAFGDPVHAGRPHVAQHGPDPGAGQDRVERGGEARAAVADHELDSLRLLAEVHEQVAGLLRGPFPGGVQGDSEDADARVACSITART